MADDGAEVAAAVREADISLLRAHSVRPFPTTGSFICSRAESCGIEIPNCEKSMRQHLHRNHNASKSVEDSVWLAASRLAAAFPEIHPLREKYKSGGGEHGCLPRIEGLPLLWCKQCPTCLRLFPKDEGLRNHCKKMHGGIPRSEIRACVKVPCQSLSRRRGQSAPFRVALEDAAAPNPEEECVLTAALSSYKPGKRGRNAHLAQH